jgi:hypothetical protein
LYYVFNMIFPCLLITLVAFLGFLLPPDSIEKVGTGITTLLSLTVFLMLVAESLPPTSEQLPLLGIYYFITISIVSFSTFMAVITLNINNKGLRGKRLPRLVKIIFFHYVAKILGTSLIHNNKYKKLMNERLLNNIESTSVNVVNQTPDKDNYFINEEIIFNTKLNPTPPKQQIRSVTINREEGGLVLRASDDRYNTTNSDDLKYDLNSLSSRKSEKNNGYNNTLILNDLRHMDYLYQARCTCKTSLKKKKSSHKHFNSNFVQELDKILEKHFKELILGVTNLIAKKEKLFIEKALIDQIQGEWMDLALVCDHVLCYFFPIMTLIFCFAIFLSSPHVFSQG